MREVSSERGGIEAELCPEHHHCKISQVLGGTFPHQQSFVGQHVPN